MLNRTERAELEQAIDEITAVAHDLGYDPYPVHFEVVPAHVIYELGSYSLPARFSHWTFGRDYHRQKTSYEHGYSKIYEIVFNTDPCQAFLMESNGMTSHKLTVAHVIGHSHFFKHNDYFAHTDRRMIEKVRLHRDRIAAYEEEFGWREVEEFLDTVLCIDEHIDPASPRLKAAPHRPERRRAETPSRGEFDDLLQLTAPASAPRPSAPRFPEEPEKDLLRFLMLYGRELEEWQRDILSMVREEMLYFLPQIRTKIMNEGFASLAHERILERYLSHPAEIWEFRRLHSSVLSPPPSRGMLNPYYVGFQVLKDIERRWNGGPDDGAQEEDWLGRTPVRPVGQGWSKVFEVCQEECDASFLRKYLTASLVERLDLYAYERRTVQGEDLWVVTTTAWEEVRDTLVDSLTNFGVPVIRVEEGDWGRRGELLLRHAHEGKDLDIAYAERVLRAVYRLWGRPVHLETRVEDAPTRLSFDGEKNRQEPA